MLQIEKAQAVLQPSLVVCGELGEATRVLRKSRDLLPLAIVVLTDAPTQETYQRMVEAPNVKKSVSA